jgi:hypothetical protein
MGVELVGRAESSTSPGPAELGIDYIKLATRHLHGAVNEDAMRTYAAGLVSLVHGLGLLVLAQGVDQVKRSWPCCGNSASTARPARLWRPLSRRWCSAAPRLRMPSGCRSGDDVQPGVDVDHVACHARCAAAHQERHHTAHLANVHQSAAR